MSTKYETERALKNLDTMVARLERERAQVIENLASIDHDQWIYWSKGTAPMVKDLLKIIWALEDCMYSNVPDEANKALLSSNEYLKIKRDASERMKRWEKLQNTPYAELSEEYKDDDRKWATKELQVIEGA